LIFTQLTRVTDRNFRSPKSSGPIKARQTHRPAGESDTLQSLCLTGVVGAASAAAVLGFLSALGALCSAPATSLSAAASAELCVSAHAAWLLTYGWPPAPDTIILSEGTFRPSASAALLESSCEDLESSCWSSGFSLPAEVCAWAFLEWKYKMQMGICFRKNQLIVEHAYSHHFFFELS